jgi:hypothetical protein
MSFGHFTTFPAFGKNIFPAKALDGQINFFCTVFPNFLSGS